MPANPKFDELLNRVIPKLTEALLPERSLVANVNLIINQLPKAKGRQITTMRKIQAELNQLSFSLMNQSAQLSIQSIDDAIKQLNQIINKDDAVFNKMSTTLFKLRQLGLVAAMRAQSTEKTQAYIHRLYTQSICSEGYALTPQFVKNAIRNYQLTNYLTLGDSIIFSNRSHQFALEVHLLYLSAQYGVQLSLSNYYDQSVIERFNTNLRQFDNPQTGYGIAMLQKNAINLAILNGHADWVIEFINNTHNNLRHELYTVEDVVLIDDDALYNALRADDVDLVRCITELVKRRDELPEAYRSKLQSLDKQLQQVPQQLAVCPQGKSQLSEAMQQVVSNFGSDYLRQNVDGAWQTLPGKKQYAILKNALAQGCFNFLFYYTTKTPITISQEDVNALLTTATRQGVGSIHGLLTIIPQLSRYKPIIDKDRAIQALQVLIDNQYKKSINTLWGYIDNTRWDADRKTQSSSVHLIYRALDKLQQSELSEQECFSRAQTLSCLLYNVSEHLTNDEVIDLFDKALGKKNPNKAVAVGVLQNFFQRVKSKTRKAINDKAKKQGLDQPIYDRCFKESLVELVEDESVNQDQKAQLLESFQSQLVQKIMDLEECLIDHTQGRQKRFEIHALLTELRLYVASQSTFNNIDNAYESVFKQLSEVCLAHVDRNSSAIDQFARLHIMPTLQGHQLQIALMRSDQNKIIDLANDMCRRYGWYSIRQFMTQVASWAFEDSDKCSQDLVLFNERYVNTIAIKDLFKFWKMAGEQGQSWFSELVINHYHFKNVKYGQYDYVEANQPLASVVRNAADVGHANFLYDLITRLAASANKELFNEQLRQGLAATEYGLYQAIDQGHDERIKCLGVLHRLHVSLTGEEPECLEGLSSLIQKEAANMVLAALAYDQQYAGDNVSDTMTQAITTLSIPTKNGSTLTLDQVRSLASDTSVIQKLFQLLEPKEEITESIARGKAFELIYDHINGLDDNNKAYVARLLKWTELDESQFVTLLRQLKHSYNTPSLQDESIYRGSVLSHVLEQQPKLTLSPATGYECAMFVIQNAYEANNQIADSHTSTKLPNNLLSDVLSRVNHHFDTTQMIDLLEQAQKKQDDQSICLLLCHSNQYPETNRQQLMQFAIATKNQPMLDDMSYYFESSLSHPVKQDLNQIARENGLSLALPCYVRISNDNFISEQPTSRQIDPDAPSAGLGGQ